MDTPRKTKLYKQIAKDYMPKQAAMMICKYIEDMECRLEQRLVALEAPPEEEKKPARKSRQATDSPASAPVADNASGEADKATAIGE